MDIVLTWPVSLDDLFVALPVIGPSQKGWKRRRLDRRRFSAGMPAPGPEHVSPEAFTDAFVPPPVSCVGGGRRGHFRPGRKCGGGADRLQLAQARLPIGVVRLGARGDRLSPPVRFSLRDTGLTDMRQQVHVACALRCLRPPPRTAIASLHTSPPWIVEEQASYCFCRPRASKRIFPARVGR